jgi:hypothetical protein
MVLGSFSLSTKGYAPLRFLYILLTFFFKKKKKLRTQLLANISIFEMKKISLLR